MHLIEIYTDVMNVTSWHKVGLDAVSIHSYSRVLVFVLSSLSFLNADCSSKRQSIPKRVFHRHVARTPRHVLDAGAGVGVLLGV